MIIWIVFAVLTALAGMSVLVPYARGRKLASDALAARGGSDAEVYKDQLAEIDKDAARGILSPAEAQSARIEVSRRLLKADEAQDLAVAVHPSALPGQRTRSGLVLLTAFLLVPLSAVLLYMTYGNPDMPDRPLAQRVATSVENQDVAILVARVEEALRLNPDDARGWAILAPIYTRQGNFDGARAAFEQLIRLQGQDPVLLTDLGELIVIENEGQVTQEAMARFHAALQIDASLPKARYYQGLGLVQAGRMQEARAALQALRDDGGPDAPWVASVDALLADMEAVGPIPSETGPRLAPPDPQSAQAIAALPQDERQAAIIGMVEGLAARLENAPDDLAGWSQLVRAYAVLGDQQAAGQSLSAALAQFADDDPARQRLLTIAQELNIEPATP